MEHGKKQIILEKNQNKTCEMSMQQNLHVHIVDKGFD